MRIAGDGRGKIHARSSVLGFGVGTDKFETGDIDPEPAASCAFFERSVGDLHILEFHLAARAVALGIFPLQDRLDAHAAVRAELSTGEHHAHAVGAGHRLQQGVAILALRRIFLDDRSALGAIERACFHGFDSTRIGGHDENGVAQRVCYAPDGENPS